MTKKVVFADIETTGAQNLFSQTPKQQFRLGQWAIGRDGEVQLTEDYDTFMHVIDTADLLVFHYGINYDLTSLYGKDSTRPLELALENKVLDTFIWYFLRHRIPAAYTNRAGRKATTYSDGKQKPPLVAKFLSLDNLAFQHGLPGKVGSLQDLAKKYNPPKTLVKDLDYGLIPTDDPEFREYSVGDIVSLKALASMLMDEGPITPYEWREMVVWAVNAQLSRNGFTVDADAAQGRVAALNQAKDEQMSWLVEQFDFPTEGKAPWKSAKGQGSILKAFDTFGIRPEGNPDWLRSDKTNAPLFNKDVLKAVSEGTDAEPLADAIILLQGQRPLAQLALDSMWPDGKAHPNMDALQRSGRFSMTNPSLPIWGNRTDALRMEKEYFVASPGCKLVEMDFSNADQRIVAALSGDEEYAKRFEPGVDGHEISGRLMFGDEAYEAAMLPGWETNADIRKANPSRHIAKALSHAFAYGAGAKTLARTARKDKATANLSDDELLDMAYKFIDAMNRAYPWNKRWREKAAQEGDNGFVTNSWGRRMFVDDGRSFTMSPGLLGQAGTREIMMDGLIRIAVKRMDVIRCLVASVHDAVIWDIPEKDLDWMVPFILENMETDYHPGTIVGQTIRFTMSAGRPSDNWAEASHG